MFQCGGQKISMSKKLHKKLEKLLGQEVLDEEGALLACSLVLTEAFEKATLSNDLTIMIDIADRWLLLSKMLSGNEEDAEDDSVPVFKGPLGFISELQPEEGKNDDAPEQPDKG